ncbi:MAG: rRNA maturation RNase YbeY [Bacilli bacterium]|nr:rRNA maturation RNase YbeY [Bacilli bacterium]
MGDFKMIEVNNLTNEKLIEIEELDDYGKYLLDYMKINASFSVIIVDNKEIHKINKEYRGIDRPTDVISFALEEDENYEIKERLLGDIYISIDKVYEQAKEYNHSVKRELFFLVTHGFLHLLGYDHMKKEDEEIMFPLQEKILDKYGVKRG